MALSNQAAKLWSFLALFILGASCAQVATKEKKQDDQKNQGYVPDPPEPVASYYDRW